MLAGVSCWVVHGLPDLRRLLLDRRQAGHLICPQSRLADDRPSAPPAQPDPNKAQVRLLGEER